MIGTITIDGKVYALADNSKEAFGRLSRALYNTYLKYRKSDAIVEMMIAENNGTVIYTSETKDMGNEPAIWMMPDDSR